MKRNGTRHPRILSVSLGMLVLLCLGGLFAISRANNVVSAGGEGSPRLAADMVLWNGKILTLDDSNRTVGAVAILGKQIVAVGSNEEIRRLEGPGTKVVDLGGRTALPGLVDAHSHTAGVPLDWLNLFDAHSILEIQQKVAQKAVMKAAGEWIIGSGNFMTYSGWDERRLKEKRWITRWDIDPVSPNNPVLLMKDAGHALVLNSVGLARAGITKDTPDPRGEIVRDPKTGELTGALLESAMNLAYQALPTLSDEALLDAARGASQQLLGWGTTTVADASVTDDQLRLFQKMHSQSDQPLVSTIVYPLVPATQPLEENLQFVRNHILTTGFGNEDLKIGALKIFMDGGVTSRGAWFKTAYKDRPGYYGIPQVNRKTLFETVRLADQLGWQLHFHTCGDAAAELALDALEAAQKENKTSGRRHALTHLYVLTPEMIARMKRLGVIAVLQPNFVYTLGEHMRAALDDSMWEHFIPFKSLLEAGVPVALSADGHPENPFYGIYGSVIRKTEAGNPLGSAEAVTVLDALRAYTRTSAYALFEENRRGSIEPGKLADVIVLGRDILKIPPEEIKDIQVLLTVKHGRIAIDRLSSGKQ